MEKDDKLNSKNPPKIDLDFDREEARLDAEILKNIFKSKNANDYSDEEVLKLAGKKFRSILKQFPSSEEKALLMDYYNGSLTQKRKLLSYCVDFKDPTKSINAEKFNTSYKRQLFNLTCHHASMPLDVEINSKLDKEINSELDEEINSELDEEINTKACCKIEKRDYPLYCYDKEYEENYPKLKKKEQSETVEIEQSKVDKNKTKKGGTKKGTKAYEFLPNSEFENLVSFVKERNDDPTFGDLVYKIMNEHEMEPSEVYKRADMSKQNFSRVTDYRCKNVTLLMVWQMAVGLRCTIDEADQLLFSAGYIRTNSKLDLTMVYFISNQKYNIELIDQALYKLGLKTFAREN